MRSVLILGAGRCGTSAVAQVLHKLGCSMGDEFYPHNERSDPFGTWEDKELTELTNAVAKGEASSEGYEELVQKRNHRMWGFKTPKLIYTAQFLWPLMDDVRVIAVFRRPADIINSAMRAYYIGRRQANAWYSQSSAAFAARLAEFNGTILRVDFEDLLQNPAAHVRNIMHFAFDKLPSNRKLGAAVECIKQGPKRVVRGWGSLAAGVRIAKHPEAQFFIDWTALVSSGLRNYDTILLPQKFMPSHWAASELARDFLKNTDKDTLFLLDDDVSFPVDALHRMRENQATWEYDAVMALITRRNIQEPSAVMMHHMGQQPLPASLHGDHFLLRPEFEEGKVVEVDAVGLAFTLIRRHVLESIVDPEHGIQFTDFFTWGKGREGDDIPFSRGMREKGQRMAIDAGVQVAHITAVPVTWDMVKQRVNDIKAKAGVNPE